MNIFDFPKEKFPEEITKILHQSQSVRIEQILSDGQSTDWVDQEEAEWVCLIKGKAQIEFEDGVKTLEKGDTLMILPHERHRVIKTTKCIWLCVFFEEKPQKTHYVYLLLCADDTLYCGYTTDLEARVKTHNQKKGAKYTKARLPVSLVYSETFKTKSQALKRECELKKHSREEKLQLIENSKKNVNFY